MSATTDSRPSSDLLAMAMRPDEHHEQLGGVVALGEQQIAAPQRADGARRQQVGQVLLGEIPEEVGVRQEGALDHRPARLPAGHGRLTR